MTNKIDELFKIADTISDTNLREKYLEILRDSNLEKMWLDKYHLTMAHTSFLEGKACEPATYEMFIRKNPFGGSYTVSAGLGPFLEWLNDYGFSEDTIKWLANCKNKDGTPTFKPEFLEFLRNQKLSLTIDAVPEGELVFPNEPIVRVSGPEWQVGLVETAILNGLNASCLIATKASRIVNAACGRPVMEFGLRRAQDMYGMRATRSAAVGGVLTTSNADAARKYNLGWVGTHAHSFVMRHDTEIEAFENWLLHNQGNTTILVDTYDTIQGVKNAIAASKKTGVHLDSIRLDSGNLAKLSIEARQLLDAAGLHDCQIIASNDLDEYSISKLWDNGAKVDILAVGTNLVTAADQPSLGGVYKLKSINGVDKMKISGDAIKRTIPGATEIVRMLDGNGNFMGDVITAHGLIEQPYGTLDFPIISVNARNSTERTYEKNTMFYKPMVRVVTDGVIDIETMNRNVADIADSTAHSVAKLDKKYKRVQNACGYHVEIEQGLYKKQTEMVLSQILQRTK
ncbi:MAG: nicotinate phosphoribosyltransferase [Alphaproteobacteria bacterium]|nr:nicotinate phosphoribosyltransferase [Alphaproteobacteria bacterium]